MRTYLASYLFFCLALCFALLLACMVMYAQDPNPQTSFATTVLYANPSLYLNFNDATASSRSRFQGLRL